MAKVTSLVLLNHLGDPPVCQNVSCMDQPIEHLSCLLDQVGLIGVVLQLVVGLQVEDHVERLPVVRHLLVQPSKVELVLQRFIYICEVEGSQFYVEIDLFFMQHNPPIRFYKTCGIMWFFFQ